MALKLDNRWVLTGTTITGLRVLFRDIDSLLLWNRVHPHKTIVKEKVTKDLVKTHWVEDHYLDNRGWVSGE